MSLVHNLPEPPTSATLAEARRELAAQRQSVRALTGQIQAAEDRLARIVEESRCAIRELERDRAALEEKLALTLAYVSPIRRLPHELLRYIFLLNFEEYPCCAWVLSAVCSLWRRLALSMPKLWSKIRLVTTPATSADTIRLWLERSGPTVPLDIEIFLRAQPLHAAVVESSHRRRVSSFASPALADWAVGGGPWTTPAATLAHAGAAGAGTAAYVHVPQTPGIHIFPLQATAGGGMVLTNAAGVVSASTAHGQDDLWGMPPLVAADRATLQQRSKKNMHWGYIAFFYLAEQMHRWERFVFRFDRQFLSHAALKAIDGDAPLLREFEVSSAEPGFYSDFKWLPTASPNAVFDVSSLQSLTLHYVPFKWSSPMLRNLRSLSIRTLPTVHLALDRIMFMIAASPQLETLSLHFSSPTPPVLPLTATTLPKLKSLTLSGHYLLASLVEALVLPHLDSLVLDIEAREPIEDTVSTLLTRSNNPPLTRLSLAYGLGPTSSSYYFGGGAGVTSWHFLGELDHLRALQVGSAPFEPLLAALGAQDEDAVQAPDHWVCPNLAALAMRGCHAHADGVAKLVQMVEVRNPPDAHADAQGGFGGPHVGPARLRHLELYDCAALGPDVLKWLKSRIDDVVCTEPVFDSSPRSPSFSAYIG